VQRRTYTKERTRIMREMHGSVTQSLLNVKNKQHGLPRATASSKSGGLRRSAKTASLLAKN
jgi:signal transduction histidine kinase